MESGGSLQNELEILKSRLKQSLDRAGLWMNEEANQLEVIEEKRHEKSIKELQEERLKIQTRISSQQKEYVETNQILSDKCKKLEDLKTELEKLCGLTQELNTAKTKSERDVEGMREDIQQIKKDIEVPTKDKQKLQYLNKSSGVFGNMLGMTLKKTTGKRLLVTFTHIDDKDPLKKFFFFIKIQELSKNYIVSDPEPPIDGLESLEQELNTTNNIRQFIIAIRKKFQQTVKKQ